LGWMASINSKERERDVEKRKRVKDLKNEKPE
jgi:hypothetical protein